MTVPTPAQTVDEIRAAADEVAASNNPTLAIGDNDGTWIVTHGTVSMEEPIFRAIAAEFDRMRERIAALEAERDTLKADYQREQKRRIDAEADLAEALGHLAAIIAAEDAYVEDTNLKLDDPISDAVEAARALAKEK